MCNSCEAVMINRVLCHEIGCPDRWRDCSKECKWCEQVFKPEEKYQEFCSTDCAGDYNS